MGNKKSFVLRMDPEVYNALERLAADEFRSMNGQIEYILVQTLKKSGRLKGKKENNRSGTQDADEKV